MASMEAPWKCICSPSLTRTKEFIDKSLHRGCCDSTSQRQTNRRRREQFSKGIWPERETHYFLADQGYLSEQEIFNLLSISNSKRLGESPNHSLMIVLGMRNRLNTFCLRPLKHVSWRGKEFASKSSVSPHRIESVKTSGAEDVWQSSQVLPKSEHFGIHKCTNSVVSPMVFAAFSTEMTERNLARREGGLCLCSFLLPFRELSRNGI